MKLNWIAALILSVSLGAAVPASAQLGTLLKAKQAMDTVNKAKQIADAAQKAKQVMDAAQKAKQVMDAAQHAKQAIDVANHAREAVDAANHAREAVAAAQHAREAADAANRARIAVRPIEGRLPVNVGQMRHVAQIGRTWAARGGYRGFVVPNSFRFGFNFRPVFYFNGVHPCFSSFSMWNGSFMLVDPVPASWPADWYAANDLSINPVDGGGYVAVSAAFPGINLSIAASPFTCEHLALGASVSVNGDVEDKVDDSVTDQPADTQADQTPQVQQVDPAVEIAYWNSVKDSTDPADLASYVTKYPQGEFVDLAQRRLDKLATPVVEAPPVVATPKLAGSSWTGQIEFTSPALFLAGHMTRTVGRAGAFTVTFNDGGTLSLDKSGSHISGASWGVDGTTVTMHLAPTGCRGQGATFTGAWSDGVIQGTWSEISASFMTCGNGAGTFILNAGGAPVADGRRR